MDCANTRQIDVFQLRQLCMLERLQQLHHVVEVLWYVDNAAHTQYR
jgi:hypothetical protein